MVLRNRVPADIQGRMALIAASLAAHGRSRHRNIQQVDTRYERVSMNACGASAPGSAVE